MTHSPLFERCFGIFFIGMLLVSASAQSTLAFVAAAIMGPINRRIGRRLVNWALGTWLALPAALLELIYGTKVVSYQDKLKPDETTVMILNHRTRLDWMFLFCWVARYGRLCNMKIVLKAALRNMPGLGPAMELANFLFLQRSWEKDEQTMIRVLTHYVEQDLPVQLLIFPEGTNLTADTMAVSDRFAKKNNLPRYSYVLHPRTRGFGAVVSTLRLHLDSIHDISVGYKGNILESESDIITGKFPSEIHFHSERFGSEVMDLPQEKLEEWCVKRWERKEERLEKFYRQGTFANEGRDESQPFYYLLAILIYFGLLNTIGAWILFQHHWTFLPYLLIQAFGVVACRKGWMHCY